MKRKVFLFILLAIIIGPAYGRKVKLKIYDKILFITHPLMIKAKATGTEVKFTWSEPHSDFHYYLEIYREGTKRPIGTIPVEGRSKVLKFKKEKKKRFWRVFAKSKHGHVTPNKRKFLIPL